MKTIGIFDIGKTHKKFYLFNERFQEVYRKKARFAEIPDDDGFPSENLPRLVRWIHKTLEQVIDDATYDLQYLNFTTYGPALVHLDEAGKIVCPIYNDAKAIPKALRAQFYEKYGGETQLSLETGSPCQRMKNAGLQLYWLKHTKPVYFQQIKHSLFLPQYLSYLLTGKLTCDYTCLGHHTTLWNYTTRALHSWTETEGLGKLIAPIYPSNTTFKVQYKGTSIQVGIGIKGSAAALKPYLLSDKLPFILLSTGDDNVALNPFKPYALTANELSNGCLKVMQYDGNPVKIVKLPFGDVYKLRLFHLYQQFKKKYGYHRQMVFQERIYQQILANPTIDDKAVFETFPVAYHYLIWTLVQQQVQSIRLVVSGLSAQTIYVEGVFAKNNVLLQMLKRSLPTLTIKATLAPYGTAIGAAMILFPNTISNDFLKVHFGLLEC